MAAAPRVTAPGGSGGAELERVARDYLAAFTARDLDACLAFYADEATIDFQISSFRGRRGIEAWHRDRFAANLRLVELESVETRGETVVIDVVAASDRLAAWGLHELSGRVTLDFEDGKVVQARFAPRMMSPIDMIRSE